MNKQLLKEFTEDPAGGGENKEPERIQTSYNDILCDDEVQYGTNKIPVFNVDQNEFMQNMSYGRKRLRFKNNSDAQKYNTRSNSPFYIQYKNEKGQVYRRKIDKSNQMPKS